MRNSEKIFTLHPKSNDMTRHKFIDGCLMSSAAAWVSDAPKLLEWINEVADERAKQCPFDDNAEQPTLYPWDRAPNNAMWATTNYDGRVQWWREQPTWDGYSWGTYREVQSSFIAFSGKHKVTDFKNSLEKRPQ